MSIVVNKVNKYYKQQHVLKDVSFEVNPGRIVGFLGPNGAGKSTMMRILAGIISPNSGEVKLLGEDIQFLPTSFKNRLGYLPEHNPLYSDMYVMEFLNFVASIHQLGEATSQQLAAVIEVTGLGPEQHKKIGQLSKGYKQRVGLAQAILHDPEILLLDEPTTGLDPNQLLGIRQLIRQLGSQKTLLISTHIMQEVEAICDDVIVIDQGEIVAYCALDEIQQKYGFSTVDQLFTQMTAN